MSATHPVYRAWAEIDLDAVSNNLRWIRYGVGEGRGIVTVVKADAYGHGLPQIAAHLMQNGTDILGVANVGEAAQVRTRGEGWPILMLGACYSSAEFESLCRDDAAVTITSSEEAVELNRVARRLGCRAKVHLKVDTGMSRIGVTPDRALELAQEIAKNDALDLDGVYTHLSSSEEDASFTHFQLSEFKRCLEGLKSAEIAIPKIHAINSGGIVYERSWIGNFVRPGLLVYGIVPPGRRLARSEWVDRLQPVLSLKSRVTHIKQVGPGTPVSYGQKGICARYSILATIGIGYGDGVLRSASGRMEVLLRGIRCRVIGVITMDQLIVDVTHVPNVRRGDEAVLIGRQGSSMITCGQLSRAAGTIPWEVLTSITQRVPRLYKGISVG